MTRPKCIHLCAMIVSEGDGNYGQMAIIILLPDGLYKLDEFFVQFLSVHCAQYIQCLEENRYICGF